MLDRPLEHDYWDQNQSVLGMDEAGRGPIAGPLMVAGVIFPKGYQNVLIDLTHIALNILNYSYYYTILNLLY